MSERLKFKAFIYQIFLFLEKIHESLFNIISNIEKIFVFIVMRCFNIGCSLNDVKIKCYNANHIILLSPNNVVDNIDDILCFCREEFEREENRLKSVDEKFKVLLTVCSILFSTLIMVILKISDHFSFIMLIPLLFFLLSILMLLIYIDIKIFTYPNIDNKMASLESAEFKKQLANDYLLSTRNNSNTINFMVDVYKVARRSLLIGLILGILFSMIYRNKIFPFENNLTEHTKDYSSTIQNLKVIKCEKGNFCPHDPKGDIRDSGLKVDKDNSINHHSKVK